MLEIHGKKRQQERLKLGHPGSLVLSFLPIYRWFFTGEKQIIILKD